MQLSPRTFAVTTTFLCGAVLTFLAAGNRQAGAVLAQQETAPLHYAQDGSFMLPPDYREWVFLSSGMDMSYDPNATATDHHSFNNVFASPAAYQGFKATGTWPDKTVLVLEIRGAEKQPSLDRRGQTQGRAISGIEVHLKDSARFPGGWAFFDVDGKRRGRYLQPKEDCYRCHRDHAAVDTTFAQFYPTLMPIAEANGTLSPAYLKERSAAR